MRRNFVNKQLARKRFMEKILPKTTGLILLIYWVPAAILLVIARYLSNPNEGFGVVCLATGSFIAACGGAFACAFLMGHSHRGVIFLRRFYVPNWVPWALIFGGSVIGVLIGALFFPFFHWENRNDGLFTFGSSLILIFFFFVPAAGFVLIGAKKRQKEIAAYRL